MGLRWGLYLSFLLQEASAIVRKMFISMANKTPSVRETRGWKARGHLIHKTKRSQSWKSSLQIFRALKKNPKNMHANSKTGHFRTSLIFYIEVIDRNFLFICPPTCPTCKKKKKNSTRICFVLSGKKKTLWLPWLLRPWCTVRTVKRSLPASAAWRGGRSPR